MSLYTGLDTAPRRYRSLDGKPPRPRRSIPPASGKRNSDVPTSEEHDDTAIPPQIPDQDVLGVISQKPQVPSTNFSDCDMLPSQRRRRGDMGSSYYDQLAQESGNRPWLRAMQNIGAQSAQETSSNSNTTTPTNFSNVTTRRTGIESASSRSTQSIPNVAPAQKAESQSANGASRTFDDILRGMETVPMALKKK